MKKKVADIIVESLVSCGIEDCFGVVGGGAMHLDNALVRSTQINTYFNHHEQASAMAAEAYARVVGKMPVVCVTSGPGGTNTLTGVIGAWQDSLPMIILSGQVRYETTAASIGLPLRYRGIQEFDTIGAVSNMTKYALMVTDPLDVRRALHRAIRIATSGRRGPVWLDIPLNVQGAWVEEEDLYPIDPISPLPQATHEAIQGLMECLGEAKRPCVLAGNGIRSSHTIEAFRRWAKALGIPVVASALSADIGYREDDNFYGMAGSIGPRTGNFIVQNADFIVAIGCSMGYKMTGFAQEKFAPKAKIIMIDVDPLEAQKPGIHIHQFIHTDLENFFIQMDSTQDSIKVDATWIDYCQKLKQRFSPFEGNQPCGKDERISSYYFWKQYEAFEPADSISILGNNTASSAKLQIGIQKEEQRIIANRNCGSMGYDLPAAIGAAIASHKSVICLTGDGSMMMNLQELQTIIHYKLPVKIVIFENNGYAAIRQTCKNFFDGLPMGCTPESGISFPDFEKLASAFGYPYARCETTGQVEEGLKWLFEQPTYAVLEVAQKLDDPVLPKVMSRMNEDGSFDTPALHDMAPFLDKEELEQYMF